jgi:dUTP pyrophosphatase
MTLNRTSFMTRYYVDEWTIDGIAEEAGCHRETVRSRRHCWGLPDRDRDWSERDLMDGIEAMSRCTSGASLVGDMRTLAFEIQRRTSDVMDHLSGAWIERYAPHVGVIPGGIGHAQMQHIHLDMTKLDAEALLPDRQSACSAGIDLHSAESFELLPGEQHVCHTGIAGTIPSGWVGMVCPRSGMAAKHGITVQNSPGIIDSDYRGEWMVILHNTGTKPEPYKVSKGDRIAQVVIVPCLCVQVREVPRLDETERGVGGLGSTGK